MISKAKYFSQSYNAFILLTSATLAQNLNPWFKAQISAEDKMRGLRGASGGLNCSSVILRLRALTSHLNPFHHRLLSLFSVMPIRSSETDGEKPCRACTDFKSWAKLAGQKQSDRKISTNHSNHNASIDGESGPRQDCPLTKDELGKQTWGVLHTMAAYYPKTPSRQQQSDMRQFFTIFSQFYPCEVCAQDLQKELSKHPPVVDSQKTFEKWLCDLHNIVNVKLGKPIFDCSKVNERWKDGWLDGSCD